MGEASRHVATREPTCVRPPGPAHPE